MGPCVPFQQCVPLRLGRDRVITLICLWDAARLLPFDTVPKTLRLLPEETECFQHCVGKEASVRHPAKGSM